MPSLLDMLAPHLTPDAMDAIGRETGLERDRVEAALPSALAVLTSGLETNVGTREGGDALLGALDRDHDGGLLQDLPGLLGEMGRSQGGGIVGHILGGRRDVAEQAVGRASGMDSGSAANLLAMLAPIVMGALGQQRRSGGLGLDDLAGMMSGDRRRIDDQMPSQGGMLTRILDADGDGSMLDEVAEIGGGLLSSLFGGRR